MRYQIVGKNIEVTDAIKQAILDKLAKMDKYFLINDEVECRVVVRSYKVGTKIEVTIFTNQMDLRAEVSDPDLYAGVDLVVDKLEGQMRKLKTRMARSKGGRLSLGQAIAFENIEEDEYDEENDVLVRTKNIDLKPMSLEDAVTRMRAIDHPFFLYLDEEDNKISVVYVRDDGGYGVIQAENALK